MRPALAAFLLIGLTAAVAAQDAPSTGPDDPALAAAQAAFAEGSAAYQAKDAARARAHYERALRLSEQAFPEAPEQRNAWQAGANRAIAWCYALEGNGEGLRQAGRQAWVQLIAAGGDPREESLVEQACYDCLPRIADVDARVAFLAAWRADLERLVPDPVPPRVDVYRRLRRQIGQLWHEQANVEQAAGRLDVAAETLRHAIAYRHHIDDLLGTAWSSQNRFWILLRLERDAEAAAQCGNTVDLLRRGAGLEIEAALAANLEAWLDQRVAAGETARATGLLQTLRESGKFSPGGLATLTAGRLLAMELELLAGTPEATPARLDALGRALVAAGTSERQPAWTFTGALTLATQALSAAPVDADAAAGFARTALLAAETLDDDDRATRARLALARALAAAGDPAAAESTVRAIFAAHGAPGTDPYLREAARRAGADLAAATANADWAAFYRFDVRPAPQHAIAGHTWLGADLRAHWQAVARLTGDGAILTCTRRGRHLILRSPFATGTQAVETGWRLRYVNANGILLAVQGADIAVVGRRAEPTAPSAPGGTLTPTDDGLDLASLRGPRLPPLAPRVTLTDGETAFVNRFLRIHR